MHSRWATPPRHATSRRPRRRLRPLPRRPLPAGGEEVVSRPLRVTSAINLLSGELEHHALLVPGAVDPGGFLPGGQFQARCAKLATAATGKEETGIEVEKGVADQGQNVEGFYGGVLLAVDVVDSEERWPGREGSVANLDIVIFVVVSEV